MPDRTASDFMSRIDDVWKHGLSSFICETLRTMRQSEENYRITGYTDDYTLVLNTHSPSSGTCFCIGYPFPIYEQEMSKEYTFADAYIKVCVHGMGLRNAQKTYFLEQLSQKVTVQHRLVRDEETFRTLFQLSVGQHRKELWYYDSYRFIGDSILNTYMMDSLSQAYDLSPVLVSRHSHHLKELYIRTVSISSDIVHREPNQVFAFADLLDNDSGWIYEHILQDLVPGVYLFPGKNFFFVLQNQRAQVVSLDCRDVLLKDQNVFDYMHSCVQPFVESVQTQFEAVRLRGNIGAVYLNFSTSLEAKSLTAAEVQGIVDILHHYCIEIWMSAGFDEASRQITQHIKGANPHVRLVQTRALSDVSTLLRSGNIDMVISPDSSICHLAVKEKLPIVIIYKTRYWDSRSLVSLSAESPLGFCGPDPHYLPILLSEYTEKRMLIAFDQLMDYLVTGSTAIFDNTSIAKFESLLSAFGREEASKLRTAARKNDLKYKLEVYYK